MSELTVTVPDIRRANKAEAAEFFAVTLPTIEKWIRDGMPVVQRGARGVSWIIDLHHVAEWRYQARLPTGEVDPDRLPAAERKLWYDGEARRIEVRRRKRELFERDEVLSTISEMIAIFADQVRGIPDRLEREVGLTPAQAEAAENLLNAELVALKKRLVAIGNDHTA